MITDFKTYTLTGKRNYFLYVFYNRKQEVLYIGHTVNPVKRMLEHRRKSPWFTQAVKMIISPIGMTNRQEAERIEREAIFNFNPKHNKTHNYTNYADPQYSAEEDVDISRLRFALYGYRGNSMLRFCLNDELEVSARHLQKWNLAGSDSCWIIKWLPPVPEFDWHSYTMQMT